MLSDKQTALYLDRIGLDGSDISLDTLISAHLETVTYENLDMMNNVKLSLDNDRLYRKIVEEHRGGYCFELQGIFRELLMSLGYKVDQLVGRFIDPPGSPIQMRRHRVLIAEHEGEKYVCDVGVRIESTRIKLLLDSGCVQSDGFAEYKMERDSFYGHVILQNMLVPAGSGWQRLYAFTDEPQLDIDYEMPSFYCERHPDSPFNKFSMIGVRTDYGMICLDGRYLKRTDKDGTKTILRIEDEKEAAEITEKYFGLRLPKEYKILTGSID